MTANRVWRQTLKVILENGHDASPRGMPIKETLCKTSIVNMRYPIVTNPERQLNFNFMFAEAYWILSGSSLLQDIEPWLKKWREYSDDGYTLAGAYGPKVVSQLRYVIDTLTRDQDSRQAVMSIWRENPRPSKDIPCTLSLQFLIRGGHLHCVATMRSSDIWLGWPYDVFNFSMIAYYIILALMDRDIKAEAGQLCLVAGSQHLYARNLEKTAKINLMAENPEFGLSPYLFASPQDLLLQLRFARDGEPQLQAFNKLFLWQKQNTTAPTP